MAWDIYGNTLERGCCEVHPHVREEYPCSICILESNRDSIERQKERQNEREREKEWYDAQREHELHLIASKKLSYRILCWMGNLILPYSQWIGKQKQKHFDKIPL